jgi:hypothetical protein
MEITLPAAEQFLGLVFTLLVVQLIKKPFMCDPAVVKMIRIGFFVSAIIQLLIAYYIKTRISKTNNPKKFKYKPEASILNVSENPEQEVEITFAEYDNNEVTKMLRSIAFQTLLYAVLAIKFNNTQPMLLQTLNLLKSLLLSPLYRIYLYGMKDVRRPFSENLLFPTSKKEQAVPVAEEAAEKKKKKEE